MRHAPSGALLSLRSSSSQHDLAIAATRCADQCWQVSDRFQQFESMCVLVAIDVISHQQAVLELRHVDMTVIRFRFRPCNVAEELQSSATDDVSSWSA